MNQGLRVQIVDDSLLMRNKMASVVKKLNYEVVGLAANGRQAIKDYEDLQPDIVIMDVAMPEMSGIETVKLMVARYPKAKIIMVSGLNQKKMVIEALENGAKHFIIKPFQIERLQEAVSHVLEAAAAEEFL